MRETFLPIEARESIRRRFFEVGHGVRRIALADGLKYRDVEDVLRASYRTAQTRQSVLQFIRRAAA